MLENQPSCTSMWKMSWKMWQGPLTNGSSQCSFDHLWWTCFRDAQAAEPFGSMMFPAFFYLHWLQGCSEISHLWWPVVRRSWSPSPSSQSPTRRCSSMAGKTPAETPARQLPVNHLHLKEPTCWSNPPISIDICGLLHLILNHWNCNLAISAIAVDTDNCNIDISGIKSDITILTMDQ